jgi:hypothetical protein
MPDNTKVATLRTRLETIIKKAEDTETQDTAARHHVQATRLLEKFKATTLEQTATAAWQRVPSSSSSSLIAISHLIPTASSTYKGTLIIELQLQTTTILNIRQLVNIILDSSFTNVIS